MAFFGRHRSAMKTNAPGRPRTGRTNVLCESKVSSAPGPTAGFPSSVQGPQIESATAERAAFGAHPVQPEAIR